MRGSSENLFFIAHFLIRIVNVKNKIDKFIELADIFEKNGHELFLVGGSARDYLLKRDFKDFDVASSATPDEIKKFLPGIDMTFAKYGSVSCRIDDTDFDITTFRKECKYIDSRHPSKIEFISDMSVDYIRRDFTINAIYIDKNLNIHDFGSSIIDLSGRLIRIIGQPKQRIEEDPLRILRAIRFSLVLDFEIEESLEFTIKKYSSKLSELNKDKINQEIKKMKDAGISSFEIKAEFSKYNVLPGWKI